MDTLEQAFGPAIEELLVFPYSTDMEEGGSWMDLDPVTDSENPVPMPLIDIHHRDDGICGVRIHYNNNVIERLVAFIPSSYKLEGHNLELIAAQVIQAAYGVRCEVVIYDKAPECF